MKKMKKLTQNSGKKNYSKSKKKCRLESVRAKSVLRSRLCTGDLVDGYQYVAETCFLYLQGKTIYYYFLRDLRVISTMGSHIPEKSNVK